MPPPTPSHQHEPWHLKKEIQLGHVITTITVAAAAMVYVQRQEQRIALVEQQLITQRDVDRRQDDALADKTLLLGRQLERIEAKLDRLVERNTLKH